MLDLLALHSTVIYCITSHCIRLCYIVLERDVAQWLERGALPMSLPAARFRMPLGAGFSEWYHVSPHSILRHYFDVVSLGKAHASLDSGVNEYLLRQRWQCVRLVPSAEMAASAVCSKKGSWNGTWLNRSSDQGEYVWSAQSIVCALYKNSPLLLLLFHRIALYCMVLHCFVSHRIAFDCLALHRNVLNCIVLICIGLHSIVLHCDVLHCIILYYIVLH